MTLDDELRTLTDDCGWVESTPLRSCAELRGEDRRAFLHNFCTNDVRNSAVGTGCEALLLDAKGRTLFYVFTYCRDDGLVLDAAAGRSADIVRHLERYLIRERVTLVDRSGEWGELLVAGRRAADVLRSLGMEVPDARLSHREIADAPGAFVVRSVLAPGPNYAIIGPAAAVETVRRQLPAAGARGCSTAAAEALRIAAGTPLDGVDVTPDNLPQELDRNDRAIHFRKGCYLGQETVARLDALGHVNRTLVRLHIKFDADAAPTPAGTELRCDGRTVGRVTSTAQMPGGEIAALGYVACGYNSPGTVLEATGANSCVVAPPAASA